MRTKAEMLAAADRGEPLLPEEYVPQGWAPCKNSPPTCKANPWDCECPMLCDDCGQPMEADERWRCRTPECADG